MLKSKFLYVIHVGLDYIGNRCHRKIDFWGKRIKIAVVFLIYGIKPKHTSTLISDRYFGYRLRRSLISPPNGIRVRTNGFLGSSALPVGWKMENLYNIYIFIIYIRHYSKKSLQCFKYYIAQFSSGMPFKNLLETIHFIFLKMLWFSDFLHGEKYSFFSFLCSIF